MGAGRVHARHPRARFAHREIAKTVGVFIVWGLWPGMPTAVQVLGASTAPPSKCPVSPSLQPMTVALGLRDGTQKFPMTADPTITLVKLTGPAAQSLHQHPHTGNIRSHLALRGVACATFEDTRGTGWSQPHLDAFLKLRPA